MPSDPVNRARLHRQPQRLYKSCRNPHNSSFVATVSGDGRKHFGWVSQAFRSTQTDPVCVRTLAFNSRFKGVWGDEWCFFRAKPILIDAAQ